MKNKQRLTISPSNKGCSEEQDGARFEFHPVTVDRLQDLNRFSLTHGKFRYCSCMRWRMRSMEYQASTKEERIAALERLVCKGTPVGVLAYAGEEPIGWCSIAPRETYEALERYRALPRLDDASVWSVVCFFVDSRFREKGLTLGLLRAAVRHARSLGAKIVEGYPVKPDEKLYTYMGSPSIFEKAGFHDVTPIHLTRNEDCRGNASY
jgi:GNAT superfamily N-acetyltransferase